MNKTKQSPKPHQRKKLLIKTIAFAVFILAVWQFWRPISNQYIHYSTPFITFELPDTREFYTDNREIKYRHRQVRTFDIGYRQPNLYSEAIWWNWGIIDTTLTREEVISKFVEAGNLVVDNERKIWCEYSNMPSIPVWNIAQVEILRYRVEGIYNSEVCLMIYNHQESSNSTKDYYDFFIATVNQSQDYKAWHYWMFYDR